MAPPAIRRCTAADAPAVGLLVHRLLQTAVPPARLTPVEILVDAAQRMLREEKMVAWLAEAEGRPVGVITAITAHAVFARGAFGEVNELYVDPEFRATGLAARLIETVRAYGPSQGWTRIQLTAPEAGSPGAERAWAFYARLGFADVGPTLMLKV